MSLRKMNWKKQQLEDELMTLHIGLNPDSRINYKKTNYPKFEGIKNKKKPLFKVVFLFNVISTN